MKTFRQWLVALLIDKESIDKYVADSFRLEAIRQSQRLRLQPGDILVLTSERALSAAAVERIKAIAEEMLKGANKVMVIEGGMGIKVLDRGTSLPIPPPPPPLPHDVAFRKT